MASQWPPHGWVGDQSPVYPSAAHNPRVLPTEWGDPARKCPLRGPEPGRTAVRGVALVPIRPRGRVPAPLPGRRAACSAVGVPRARGPCPETAPALPGRSVGAQHLDHARRCRRPSSSLSRRTTSGASSFIWVAQAVESVRTTSRPSANDSGVQCWATSRPTIASQREKTPCTRSSVSQPWSPTSRPSVGVERSAGRGRRGGRRCWSVSRRRRRRLAGRGRRARRRLARPGRAGDDAGQVEAGVVVRRPVGSSGRSSGLRRRRRARPGHSHRESPSRRRRRSGVPRSAAGTSSGDRRGDQHLLGAGDQLGQLRAALGVELGEDVVEDQDRVVAGRRAAGRRTPAAAPARTTRTRRGEAYPFTGQLARASSSRSSRCGPTRRDAAVELVGAAALDLGEQGGRRGRLAVEGRPARRRQLEADGL